MSRGVLRLFATLMALITIAEVFSVLPSPRAGIPPTAHAGYRKGLVHVRSPEGRASDTVLLAKAASRAGLDFVVIADEDSLEARDRGWATQLGQTDYYVEMEATTRAGKVIVFASQTASADAPAEELKRIAWQHFLGHAPVPGLFLVTSHPSDAKNPWVRLDRFPEGIELVNLQSLARTMLGDSPFESLTTGLLYLFNPFVGILRFLSPNQKDVLAWDAINSVSPGHFAIAASGLERRLPLEISSRIPWSPHGLSFRLYENAVFVDALSTDFAERRRQTYEAIAAGKLAIYSPAIFPFEGNDWRLTCGDKNYRVGDRIALPTLQACEFLITRPDPFPYPLEVRLWRDGEIEKRVTQPAATTRWKVSSPGSYRVELLISLRSALHLALDHDVSYVLYNPMYLR